MQVSGHVRKRGEHYQIIIELPPDSSTGKRNRKYKTLKNATKKQAEKYMRKMMDELETHTYIEESPMLVSEWVEQWYILFIKPNISPSTQRGYESQIKTYIHTHKIASMRLQDLTTLDVQAWLNDNMNSSPASHKPLSSKTVKNIFHNLDAAMKKAVDLDMIRKNPCHGVALPKQQKYQGAVYDDDEIAKLLQTCKKTELEIPVTLAVTLGLRRGEILALKWKHIDFSNLTIRVEDNMVEVTKNISENRTVTKAPKSASGIRTIKITERLAGLLQAYQRECFKNRLALGSKYHDEDYVVCHKDGSPYLPNTLSRKFHNFLKSHDLKPIRFHDLRHSNATLMLKNGISAKEAQLRLGHSDVSVTLGTYSHVLNSMETKTADKIEDAILGQIS